MSDQETTAIHVFISYAHEDERLKKALEKQLSLLKRQGFISAWNDRDIQAGQEWKHEIDRHLSTAQVILLLISPDFMASEYCYSVEMIEAMKRHEVGEACVIPIILRPTDWVDALFSKLQALPTDAKPVTRWKDRDEAFLNVVQGIRRVVQAFRTQQDHPAFSEAHKVDWGEAPHTGQFYGREKELSDLKQSIMDEHCHVVAILGIGGIGKSSLVATLIEQESENFDYIFGRSLQNAPPLNNILKECILFFSDQRRIELPENEDEQVSLLIQYLRKRRCLLVLDNLESVLQEGSYAGQYKEGYEGYGNFLQRIGQEQHQSCLLLTSREKPKALEGVAAPVRSLSLIGLDESEGQKILTNKGLSGADDRMAQLVRLYSGNPLALKLVAEPIKELFQSDIARFLQEDRAVVSDIYALLDQQFRRLSEAEQGIMYWLAIERESVSRDSLREDMVDPSSKDEVLAILESLRRRSLIETSAIANFTLQPVILEYVTGSLVKCVYQEFATDTIELFGSHAVMKAQSKDYIRDSQVRLILMPVAEKPRDTLGKEAFEEKCKRILSQLRTTSSSRVAYAAGNILNMLIQLEYDLNQYDFSNLTIRQAYLQGASLCDVNFEHASFVQPLFTDTFGDILSTAWSPDGSMLAAGTDNGEIRIWDFISGALRRTFRSNSDWIRSVAFSPDGTTVASGSEDYTVRIWDVSTGRCCKILQEHTNMVRAVAFSSDGQLLASGGQEGCIKLWNVVTGKALSTLRHPDHEPFYSVAFSPDKKFLASGSEDNILRLWDISDGHLFKRLEGHTHAILSVVFSPDGKLLASGSEDRTVHLWDVGTGELLKVLKGHTDWVWSVVFTADGKMLASCGEDKIVLLWDVGTGECRKTLHGHTNTVWSVPFHPKGDILASGSADQTVRFWDVNRGWCLKVLRGYTNGILSVAFSPDGKTIASGSQDKKVRLWDVKTGQCHRILTGPKDRVWSVAFSPDGRQLVSGSTRELDVWDIHNGQHQELTGYPNWVYCVLFSPDGKRLLSISDRGIYLWNLGSGEAPRIIKCTAQICSVAFSPDGNVIAGGEESGSNAVYLWDAHKRKRLKTLAGHAASVRSVAFSPDGKTIASGSDDHTIRLWDVKTGLCTKIFPGHKDLVYSVVFSPNGKSIASGSQDGTIKLWKTRTDRNPRTDGCMQTLRSDRPYERMNITGVRGITEAQKASLRALGAIEKDNEGSA